MLLNWRLFLLLVVLCVCFGSSIVPKGSQLPIRGRDNNNVKKQIAVVCKGSKTTTALVTPPPSSLMKINILMLMFYSTLGAAMPYIPLYYRHIGISDKAIGLLGAISPMITFLVSPLWGALADSTGWHKPIMLLTFIGSVIARCGLAMKMTHIVWLFAVVAISAVLNAPVKPLMDSAIMSMLVDKSDYGRSRLFGQLGFGLGSYLVGPFVQSDIRLIFYMQFIFAIPAAYLMAGFQPNPSSSVPQSITNKVTKKKKQTEKEKDKIDIVGALRHTIEDPKIAIFFLTVFVIGVSSGIIENFAYVRLTEIGGKKDNAIGICRLVSSLAGGPTFWLSGPISRKIGVNGVLSVTLLAFGLRFIMYSFMQSPWHALPAEALRGATFALFWAGSTYYVYNASPKGLSATMLSILNAMYGGLGQSIGSLIGGWMSNHFGIARTFFLCGMVDFVCLGLFLVYAGSQFQPQGQLSGSNGNLSSAESKNRKRMESEKAKKQQKMLMLKGSANAAKKGNKGDKVVIGKGGGGKGGGGKGGGGKGGGEAGLGSIVPTMAMAAVKISLMVSPIAVAWALLYSPL